MMLTDPLLPSEKEHPQDVERGCRMKGVRLETTSRGLMDAVLNRMRQWWRITTDERYLRSRISRRPAWKIGLPLSTIIVFIIDFIGVHTGSAGQAWWSIADGFCVILAFAVTHTRFALDIGTVQMDVVFGIVLNIVGFLMETNESSHEQTCSALGLIDYSFFIILTCCLGFHSLVATMFWVLCVLVCLLAGKGLVVVMMTTVVWLACVCLEFTLASMYLEWIEELSCNQRLLDCATDGFGVVSCIDGLVQQTSPKMVETLSCHDIIGRPLSSVVEDSDHATLATLLAMAEQGVPPAPVLLTCISETTQQHVDVRLVPYRLKGLQLGFCVQKLGEARSFVRRPEKPQLDADAGGTTCLQQVELQDHSGERPPAEKHDDQSGLDEHPDPHHPVAAAAAAVASTSAACDQSDLTNTQELHLPASRWSSRWSAKSRGTLSLSSFSRSAPSSGQCRRKKKVETNTVGVQATRAEREGLPPVPIIVDPVLPRAVRRRRVVRSSKSFVQEGIPKLSFFRPTPRSTRGNGLAHLVKSCNVAGQGCCEWHVAWMGFHALISEELLAPCGSLPLCKDWQCPQCRALNDFDRYDDAEERDMEQVCGVCNDLVWPILPEVVLETSHHRAGAGTESENLMETVPLFASAECADSAASAEAAIGSDSI